MQFKLIQALIGQLDPLAIGIAALSILFLYFGLKSKFIRTASFQQYAISIYALFFYLIGCVAFIGMNAVAQFFYLRDSFYLGLYWLVPFAVLCAFCGVLLGYMVHLFAQKIAPEFELKLIHASLFLLVPLFLYLFLIKPYNEMVHYAFGPNVKKQEPIVINENEFKQLESIPNQVYTPAIPIEMNDSIGIFVSGKQLKFQVVSNGFSFQYAMMHGNPSAIYYLESKAAQYLCLLIIHSTLDAIAELWVIDRTGMLVYRKSYTSRPNLLQIGADGNTLLLSKQIGTQYPKNIEALNLN